MLDESVDRSILEYNEMHWNFLIEFKLEMTGLQDFMSMRTYNSKNNTHLNVTQLIQ